MRVHDRESDPYSPKCQTCEPSEIARLMGDYLVIKKDETNLNF